MSRLSSAFATVLLAAGLAGCEAIEPVYGEEWLDENFASVMDDPTTREAACDQFALDARELVRDVHDGAKEDFDVELDRLAIYRWFEDGCGISPDWDTGPG